MSSSPQAITFLITEIARLMRRRFEASLEGAGLGLTAGEARTLAHVNGHPNLRQAQLAERMNVEPMTLVGFLDRLEARGLVERVVDPKDRRAKIVCLLPAAKPYLDRIETIAAEVRTGALGAMGAAEYDRIHAGLLAMREALINENEPA
jgi:DNA-binding MarR family transcriptional regulator